MIYLIVGRTGSGKDFLAKKLTEKGLKQVLSYATRPKRSEDEDTHIFITPEEASKFTDKVAETTINGYEYFATAKQVEESDIYIIDPIGLDVLVKNMPETEFQVIYIAVEDSMNRKINAVKRANDKIKEEEIFDKRDASEDEQFTEFEDRIYNKMDNEQCFPHNVNSVIIYKNDYSEETFDRYATQLVNRKIQIENMVDIVKECLELKILSRAEANDSKGEPKILAFHQMDEDEEITWTEETMENCAIRLLGEPENFLDIVGQYITLSKKFNKKQRK